MMKLKSTLFGVLTAVSLGIVSPYANAGNAPRTCGWVFDGYVEYLVTKAGVSGDVAHARKFEEFVRGYIATDWDQAYEIPVGTSWPEIYSAVGRSIARWIDLSERYGHRESYLNGAGGSCVHNALLEKWSSVY